MKYVHAAVSMNPLPGVVSQMADEAVAARELGLAWQVLLANGQGQGSRGGTPGRLVRYMSLRGRFYPAPHVLCARQIASSRTDTVSQRLE